MATHVRGTPATPEFRKWFDKELAVMLKGIAKVIKTEEHAPLMFVYLKNSDQMATVVLPPFTSEVSKDIAASLQRTANANADVHAAMVICEAWSTATPIEQKDFDPKKRVNERPDRVEVIIVNCLCGTMQLIAHVRINGTTKQKNRTTGDILIIDPNEPGGLSTGRFVGPVDERKLDS